MIGLVWVAVFGAYIFVIPEATTFEDRTTCEKFGAEMSSRAADYARGRFKLDWSIDVHVEFQCHANGQPA